MSEQWTIENDTGADLTVRAPNGFAVELDANSADPRERFAYFAIRQQARDIAELEVFAEIGRQWNTDSSLAKWFPLTADRLGQDAQEIAKLHTDLAAAVSENAALLAANRDLKAHFDALKGDHDEAAHFGRHFIRDDAAITPRGAIIRLGDKCTDLFVRLQQAEARLAAIEAAPTVAWQWMDTGHFRKNKPDGALVFDWRPLIARPAKD